MKMPLAAINNRENLILTSNGKYECIPSPKVEVYLPFTADKFGKFDTDDEMLFVGANKWDPNNPSMQTSAKMTSVKVELNSPEWKEKRGYDLPFSYTDALLSSRTDLLKKYAHRSSKLKLCYWDIETCSDGTGRIPKPTENPIAMIGLSFAEYDIENMEYKNTTETIICDEFEVDKQGEEDLNIIKKFSKLIEKYDPDVIVGYNSWKYDIPYILKRMEMLAIDTHGLTGISKKDCEKIRAMNSHQFHSTDPTNDVNLGIFGRRLHYDIYHVDVVRDTKLTQYGLKNRRMKTVAKKLYPDDADNIIELQDDIENIYGMMQTKEKKDKLRNYLKSDITQTRRLSEFYFGNNIEQAEELEVPLASIINRRNNTVPTLYILKNIRKKIVPYRHNTHVFEHLISRAERKYNEVKFFQGAYVDLYQSGKMPYPLYKYDFSSLYPNIIRTFNLSYENIWVEFELIDSEDIDDSPESYKAYKEKQKLTIEYNDAVLHARIKVTVDLSFRGIIPGIMDDLLNARDELKIDMEELNISSLLYMQKDSQQQIKKIYANSIYGVLSQRTGIGYLPLGATITAMGRWVTKKFCQEADKENSEFIE